jgi:hypothetical protein
MSLSLDKISNILESRWDDLSNQSSPEDARRNLLLGLANAIDRAARVAAAEICVQALQSVLASCSSSPGFNPSAIAAQLATQQALIQTLSNLP